MTVVIGAALLGATGFVVGIPMFAPRLAGVRHPPEAAAFIALTVAGAAGLFYDNVFIAMRRNGYLLCRNAVVVVLRLALPALVAGAGAFGIFSAYWLALAATLPLYVSALRDPVGLSPRLTLATDRLRAMWRYSAGNYLATSILMMPSLLMPVLVAQRVDPRHAAFYYIASLIASVLVFVPQATCRSFFAEVAHDAGRLPEALPRLIAATLGLQLPLLAVIVVAGRQLLSLFGAVYAQAYPLLLVLALTTALSSVGFVGSTLLLISGRVRPLCLLSALACAVSLLGAYLLAGRGLIWIGGCVLAGEVILAAGYGVVIRAALRTRQAR
jgi:O-antigen/teichoic acid export membrane protein